MEVGEWTQLECKGELLPARWLHSCILWGDELVIFGGKGDSYMGDLWSLDLKTQIWKQLKPKGHPPTPRYGHSAILWNSGMILFGGYDGGRWLSDTFHLDLRSLEWSEKVPPGEVPKGRDEHSAVLWGDAMVVFGGTGGGGGKFLNDTWTWNLRSGLWQQLVPKGDMPAGRCAHSAVLCNDRMAVFGGLGSALTVLNDVWMFSLETHRWERFNCEGHVPEGRCRHCAVMCDDHMVVFGGAGRKNHFDTCSLHLRTGAWTLHQDKADHPPGHRLHTAVLWKDHLVTFGGVDASGNGQHSTWSREFIATSAEAMFATAVTPPSPTSSLRHCGSSLGREALPPTPRQDTEILAAMRGVDLAEVLEACAAMAALPENAGVQKWGCIKLTHCTDHETLAADALQLVVAALRTHWTNPQVQDWASRALATLCSGMDRASCARKEEAVAEGALEALVKSARSKEVTVKRSAIGALGTLCCGEDVGRPQRVMRALEAQALEILQQTLKTDDSSRTIRKVFAALAQLMEAAPEEVSSGETLELVEKAMAVRHDNLEIQQVGRHIQQVAVPRDCAKEKPSYWSGRATDASGWSVCPVTDATTLNALRKMFLVDHPEDLGKGRDADKYSWEYDNLQIHYAWRVEHEDCWDLYAIERAKTQKMLRRLRQQGVPISPWQSKLQDPSKELPGAIYLHEAGERFLLHGCSPEVVLKILHNGFDDKVTKKGMFGAGCYFAEDAEKVDQYARPDAGPSGPGHAELAELHARLYREGRTHPGEDVFYAFVARVVCGACLHTDGLDRNRPPRDAASGQEIFVEKYRRPVNSDMKQLVEIPGTTPPERYQTLVVNVAKGPVPGVSSRSVLRNREFVSFNRVAIYPEYVLAFLRKLT